MCQPILDTCQCLARAKRDDVVGGFLTQTIKNCIHANETLTLYIWMTENTDGLETNLSCVCVCVQIGFNIPLKGASW